MQAKGGSGDVVVYDCRFFDAGARAINMGGSTGLGYFRPQPPPGYEAGRIVAVGNVFVGSDTPVAFVGSEDCEFVYNTVVDPKRWALRILQETRAEGFAPCRKGRFVGNLVVWKPGELRTHVNVGPATAPDTFEFRENSWHARGASARSRPELPVAEKTGVYGGRLDFRDYTTPEGAAGKLPTARDYGADAAAASRIWRRRYQKLAPWAAERFETVSGDGKGGAQ